MADKVTAENLNRGGRPAGTPNKTTRLLKDAIMRAAELTGEDMNGKEGLIGYCKFLAVNEPKAFATLLGKVMPLQVTGEDGGPVRITKIELVAAGHDDSTD